jgi:hypothetical protein
MRYLELMKLLNENFEIINVTNYNDSKITDIKLLDSNVDKWNEKTLYIGNYSILKVHPTIPLMIIGTDSSPILPEKSSYSIIKSIDLIKIFDSAKEFIIEDLRSEAALFELTQEVLNKKNILSLINNAAMLLGNALILTDIGQNILAYSTNFEIVDPLWADNIQRGYCSDDFIRKVRSNKQMKEWDKDGNDTVKITLPGDNQPKLVARILQDGHVAGSLIMIEHHTNIKHAHYKQLPLVGNILYESLNNDFSTGMQKSFYSSVLYNILDESENDKSVLLNISKLKFPGNMKVVVAQFSFNIKNRYLKLSVKGDLGRIFPDGFCVIYKSYIVVLVSDISTEQKELLKELALKESLYIGISWTFTDISQFKNYFSQSVTCIKQTQIFGQKEQISEYTEFSFYDMLLNISDKTSLENYCHPALKILHDYGQDFYQTLCTFLECNKNVNETADKLYIHRNTLNYRIRRIKELTNLDLDNANVVQCLICSYRIENFLNKMSINKDN